jgi:Protein of unknown function (DUF2934)
MKDMKDIRDLGDTQQHLPTHEEIERRAHEIYLKRGGQHGSDMDDWLAAEAELKRERQMESESFEPKSKTATAGGSSTFTSGSRSLK